MALPSLLARQQQGLSIHPKAIMEAAASEPMTDEQYIGTGPYQFVELQADRFTLLDRFDDYVGVDSQPSGYAGRKAAYLDEIEFIPVPEEAARVAGLQSGEYTISRRSSPIRSRCCRTIPAVTIQILPPRSYGIIILNTAGGLMTDQTMRQAVQAAIGVECRAARPPTARATSSPVPASCCRRRCGTRRSPPSSTTRATPRRRARSCKRLATTARRSASSAPRRTWATTTPPSWRSSNSKQAGFTVELEVTDEATLEENLEDDERWDMTTNAIVFRPDPVLIDRFASCTLDGKWCSDEKAAVIERLQTESDFEARYAALEELQRLWYEQAPMVKLVNNYGVAALSSNVQGLLGTDALRDRARVRELLARRGVDCVIGSRCSISGVGRQGTGCRTRLHAIPGPATCRLIIEHVTSGCR